MMGALLGLIFGIGVLLIWRALSEPRRRRADRARAGVLARLLQRAGLSDVSAAGVTAVCLGCAAATGLAIWGVSRTAPVALAFALLAGYLPVAVLLGSARRRRRELADAWPEAVDNLVSGVRAGMSLPEALAQLGHRGPESLREPFRAFAVDYQVTGRFGECLDRLKHRLADPVGDRVVEALRIAREVGGGDLGRLLRNLSGYLRDDARTRSELESRQAWAVNGARLAVAAPWLVLFMLCFQRDVISRYSSPAGMVVLAAGGAACLVAYRVMLRIGRLPEEDRVLS